MFKLLFLLLFISANNCFAQEVKFHKAETEAEKTLDAILMFNKNRDLSFCLSLYNNVLFTNKKNDIGEKIRLLEYKEPNKKDLEFCRQYFTDNLMINISKIERSKCNGNKYGYDYDCFLNTNLVTCSQDEDRLGYLYHTISENENMVKIRIISISLKSQYLSNHMEENINKYGGTTYDIIKQNNTWKISGNSCLNYYLNNDKYHN